jgi:hypothetical protein
MVLADYSFSYARLIGGIHRYLVIDEADRMMANITDNWLASLESAVYRSVGSWKYRHLIF